jgi:hypothetical protein
MGLQFTQSGWKAPIVVVVLSVCVFGTSGCFVTSVGFDRPRTRAATDFGPPETLRVCALLDDGISQGDAKETLEDYWNENEAAKYNLSVKLVSYASLPRTLSTFFGWQLSRAVANRQIPLGCDRLMYFVNRNVLDVAWSAPEVYGAPEILGEVGDDTMTRGFVVDRIASLDQVLMSVWSTPSEVARHETFHFLGCKHDLVMDQCYKHIAAAKWIENRLRVAQCYEKTRTDEFFPCFSHEGDGPILLTRSQANLIPSTDQTFKDFVQCARAAGLPLDDKGTMQAASAQDWTSTVVDEAHHTQLPASVALGGHAER